MKNWKIATFWALALALLIVPASLSATPIVVPWTGPSSFNSATIAVGPFTANSLTSITPAVAYGHSHGSVVVQFDLDIMLNGSWTNIGTFSGSGSFPLTTLFPTPIAFASGTVTSLRLNSNPGQNQSYHGFSRSTSFTFDAVPEPATWALMGTGLLGLALFRRRRIRTGR